MVLMPPNPKAIVVLFARGHGGLQIKEDGSFGWGAGNFLIRSRELFVEKGLMVVIVDAPSDRQQEPFLTGFRQSKEHQEDTQAVITWIATHTKAPIWLVGTSRGTQSVAYMASHDIQGVHGLVLTSTILYDKKNNAVPEMPLEKLKMPILVVHHENDGCALCPVALTSSLMEKLTSSSAKELIIIQGGQSKGEPCLAFAHHGFNGVEKEVVAKISQWIEIH